MVPGTFYVACNTTTSSILSNNNSNKDSTSDSNGGLSAASISASNINIDEGSYCDVHFTLKDHINNPISCRSSLCSFRSNQSRVDCQATTCSCKIDCPDLADVFKQIQGNPSIVDCDINGVCTFDIKDFFVKLQAPCTNADCQVEGYLLEEGAYTDSSSSNQDINPFIAAIPLIVLVVIAASLALYLFSQRAYFAALPIPDKSAASIKSSNGSHRHLQPINPVRELIFKDLTSIARVHGRTANGNKEKVLLAGVNGIARLGELIGVLGPSGSGKTSLLSLLAGSTIDSGRGVRVGGSIALDGVPLDGDSAQRVAYCPQDTTLLSTLTVAECIRYSALLRLPSNTPAAEINSIITGVIVELGLTSVADSLVGGGSGIRGVSGGERRRVTIAMELVTNPAVLILDEPTSGLDSFTALNLMVTLKDVARSGRIVMLSFHQPSPAMFNMLNRTFLMAEGHCVFHGAPSAVDERFSAMGLPRPAGTGSAEHMLHCACDAEALPVLLSNGGGFGDGDKGMDAAKMEDVEVGQSTAISANSKNAALDDNDVSSSIAADGPSPVDTTTTTTTTITTTITTTTTKSFTNY